MKSAKSKARTAPGSHLWSKGLGAPFGTTDSSVKHPGDIIIIDRFAPVPKQTTLVSSQMTKESSRGALTVADEDANGGRGAMAVRSLSRVQTIDGMHQEAPATASSGLAFKSSLKMKSNFFNTRKRSLNPCPGADPLVF